MSETAPGYTFTVTPYEMPSGLRFWRFEIVDASGKVIESVAGQETEARATEYAHILITRLNAPLLRDVPTAGEG